MSLPLVLAVAGLAGSAFLVAGRAGRVPGAVALVASAIEVAMALGWAHFSVTRLSLGLVLGLCLALPGLLAWLRSTSKGGITAATVVSLVGILQVIGAIGRRL